MYSGLALLTGRSSHSTGLDWELEIVACGRSEPGQSRLRAVGRVFISDWRWRAPLAYWVVSLSLTISILAPPVIAAQLRHAVR